MRLHNLFPAQQGRIVDHDADDVEIAELAYDNRTVAPGTLFFCVRGFTRDGHEFAADAVTRGAAALVVDHELPALSGVPQVVVADVRASMPPVASRFFGHPTDTLALTGVTGTNGKTTTTYLLHTLLEAAGRQTGLIGTVKSVIGGAQSEAGRTTPEAIDLQRAFRAMLDGGDVAGVIEVSSHALELGRVAATHFSAAVFTNLTQDHLDFHPTMEDYFLAKRRLFTDCEPDVSIINLDDPYGARLAAELPDAVTYSLKAPEASYRATEIVSTLRGATFNVATPEGSRAVSSPLSGAFNVYNMLAALATARTLGISLDTCVEAIRTAVQVPGRFESVDEGQPFAVLVDYAHTPDSLENVLQTARRLTDKRLHVVFGCGGDRDRGKRPLMGQIAARLADRVIVTSDNPRSEDPDAIIDEILAGVDQPVDHEVDRRQAIQAAIAAAGPGDVVVIAGKGHEQGQEFESGRKLPFDDVTVAREALHG
jgi:UDP-N-acetylmuramoyl-L-alanyl-D-glutamate--2,6-diaminopimelate ligase